MWLVGEHDVATVASLTATMDRALRLASADVVVDLSGVSFMSAATLGVIVRTRNRLARQTRTLSLRAPPDCRILDIFDFPSVPSDPSASGTKVSGPAVALSTWVAVPPAASPGGPVDGGVSGGASQPAEGVLAAAAAQDVDLEIASPDLLAARRSPRAGGVMSGGR